MSKDKTLIHRIFWCVVLIGMVQFLCAQSRRGTSTPPRIEIQNCKIEASLTPDTHELKAAATVSFKTVGATDFILLELNENLSVQKVLNAQNVELEFGQGEVGAGYLSVRFPKQLQAGVDETIRIEYQGGFDRDRFSRIYTRDEDSAYIGMEGTYLMYSAKWFPVGQFFGARSASTLEVTVPLGMTAIGPGTQLPVVTKGVSETFGWDAVSPVLPGSFVAAQYYPKKMQFGDLTIECFARESKLDPIQKSAEAAAGILEYYRQTFGPPASGNSFRLVEVDDQLARQHGMLGTIFVTRRELSQTVPPIRELSRRIAYQWWQETIGVQSAADLWLADGLSYLTSAQYMGRDNPAVLKEEIDNLAVLALKFENRSAVRTAVELGYGTDRYESVSAGKGAWVLNMLRGTLGESKFRHLISEYINTYTGVGGSTAGFQRLAEKEYGQDLAWFFTQWIDTMGVPEFRTDYVVLKTTEGFRVSGTVRQDRDLFRMPLEIGLVSGGKQVIKTVDVAGKSTSFDITSFTMPESVVLDPNNNLLRDSKELQTSVQMSIGNDLKERGDLVEAIRAYENALKLSPHRSIAHFRLAETFYEQFNLQSAANSFRDALNGDRDPRWIEVWCYIYIGKIYDILGQRQRAMAEYTKALNTKDDTNGAQAEAQKWLATPFTRERTIVDSEKKQPEEDRQK
jgi:hypothetical protein